MTFSFALLFRAAATRAMFFSALASAVIAADLNDYQKRLENARTDVIALRDMEGEGGAPERLRRQKLDEIRRSVPKSERVEWHGGSIETDNQWLDDQLTAFTDAEDPKARLTCLLSIEERLAAISEKTGEIENAEASERTKDADKQALAEILRRQEYQKAEVNKDESLFQKWWRAFWEWLEKHLPSPSIPQDSQTDFASFRLVLQVLIFAAVIGVIAFLLYRFWPYLAERFAGNTEEKKRERIILGERIAADESAVDIFADAERLAREGRLRDAIRKGYIAVLLELSDRKMIGLARHKTNRDYLRDLRKRSALFENMSGLTGAYEQNWYGLRTTDADDWEDFRAKYRQTMASSNDPS
jgi:hypothetical protein